MLQPERIQERFQTENSASSRPSYNVSPGQTQLVITNKGTRTIESMAWGIMPSWAKESGKALINARSETLAEKPTFRDAFKNRRCLVPASGYYEWKREDGNKIPYYFYRTDEPLFAFAGLYSEDGKYVIVTTAASQVISHIHDRMPVILSTDGEKHWLDNENKDPQGLQELLVPFISDGLKYHEVSKEVGNAASNFLELIKPLNE